MILFRTTEDASGKIHIIGDCGMISHATWPTNPADATKWAQAIANRYDKGCYIEWHRPFRVSGAGSLQLPPDCEAAE